MTDGKKDISPRTAAKIGLIFTLIGIGLCIVGPYALIQAWTWELPLVVLMVIGAIAFLVAWVIILFYLFVCVMELRGLTPDGIFPQETGDKPRKEGK
jgi:uncharacterized protein (DUF983 family)